MLYQRLLSQYQTHTCVSAIGAIEFLTTHNRPDLVILDFHLGGSSGLSVLDYIRAHSSLCYIPVLGISADDLLKGEAISKGVTAFLAKPINIDEVLSITEKLLAQVPV